MAVTETRWGYQEIDNFCTDYQWFDEWDRKISGPVRDGGRLQIDG
jgi:hypothetical protein